MSNINPTKGQESDSIAKLSLTTLAADLQNAFRLSAAEVKLLAETLADKNVKGKEQTINNWNNFTPQEGLSLDHLDLNTLTVDSQVIVNQCVFAILALGKVNSSQAWGARLAAARQRNTPVLLLHDKLVKELVKYYESAPKQVVTTADRVKEKSRLSPDDYEIKTRADTPDTDSKNRRFNSSSPSSERERAEDEMQAQKERDKKAQAEQKKRSAIAREEAEREAAIAAVQAASVAEAEELKEKSRVHINIDDNKLREDVDAKGEELKSHNPSSFHEIKMNWLKDHLYQNNMDPFQINLTDQKELDELLNIVQNILAAEALHRERHYFSAFRGSAEWDFRNKLTAQLREKALTVLKHENIKRNADRRLDKINRGQTLLFEKPIMVYHEQFVKEVQDILKQQLDRYNLTFEDLKNPPDLKADCEKHIEYMLCYEAMHANAYSGLALSSPEWALRNTEFEALEKRLEECSQKKEEAFHVAQQKLHAQIYQNNNEQMEVDKLFSDFEVDATLEKYLRSFTSVLKNQDGGVYADLYLENRALLEHDVLLLKAGYKLQDPKTVMPNNPNKDGLQENIDEIRERIYKRLLFLQVTSMLIKIDNFEKLEAGNQLALIQTITNKLVKYRSLKDENERSHIQDEIKNLINSIQTKAELHNLKLDEPLSIGIQESNEPWWATLKNWFMQTGAKMAEQQMDDLPPIAKILFKVFRGPLKSLGIQFYNIYLHIDDIADSFIDAKRQKEKKKPNRRHYADGIFRSVGTVLIVGAFFVGGLIVAGLLVGLIANPVGAFIASAIAVTALVIGAIYVLPRAAKLLKKLSDIMFNKDKELYPLTPVVEGRLGKDHAADFYKFFLKELKNARRRKDKLIIEGGSAYKAEKEIYNLLRNMWNDLNNPARADWQANFNKCVSNIYKIRRLQYESTLIERSGSLSASMMELSGSTHNKLEVACTNLKQNAQNELNGKSSTNVLDKPKHQDKKLIFKRDKKQKHLKKNMEDLDKFYKAVNNISSEPSKPDHH